MAVAAPGQGSVPVCDSHLGSAMGIEGLEPVGSQSGPRRISQEAGADDGVRRENQDVVCSRKVFLLCSHQLGIILTKMLGIKSEPG